MLSDGSMRGTAAPATASRRLVLGLLVVLAALGAAAPVWASRVRTMNLEEMVAAAGSIFVGQVEKIEPVRRQGVPATRVTFLIEEGLRGAPGSSLTLTFPGGTGDNGFPYRIAGLPLFGEGDRLVLLAYPASGLGLTSPVGLYQGYFPVRAGAAGLVSVAVPGQVVAGPRLGPDTQPKAEFVNRLRRLVERDDRQRAAAAPGDDR